MVYRGDENLKVRLPYDSTNGEWLQVGRKSRPVWDKTLKYWTLPRSCYSELVERLLARFIQVYTIQEHRNVEKCTVACLNAQGLECECCCLGAHHGEGAADRWFKVNDACVVRYGEKEMRWNLLEKI